MNERREVSLEKLSADFQVLIADAEQLIGATANQAGERVVELRQYLVRRVAATKESTAQCEEKLRERAERAKARVVSSLQEENWPWLALAAGLGVLQGPALRCRKSKSDESAP